MKWRSYATSLAVAAVAGALATAAPAVGQDTFLDDVNVQGNLCAGSISCSGSVTEGDLVVKAGLPDLDLVDTGASGS